MAERCDGCEFFQEWEADLVTGKSKGICRRSPPRILSDEMRGIMTCWPDVDGGDWCGEFRPAPAP